MVENNDDERINKGGIVNNFAEAIDITIRMRHKNPCIVVDDAHAQSIVDLLNSFGWRTSFELQNVDLINPISFKDLELVDDE